MKPHEFVVLVKKMRAAQKAYFARREPERLEASKALEREVDAAVKALESPSLFDDDELERRVLIVIDQRKKGGEFVAHSPDLPALTATGETMPEVVTMAAFEVSQMYGEVAPEAA